MFRPTNPMIAGILSLLAELHSLKGLKINNVFCIELVFKAFSIVAEDVKPTDLLRKVSPPTAAARCCPANGVLSGSSGMSSGAK